MTEDPYSDEPLASGYWANVREQDDKFRAAMMRAGCVPHVHKDDSPVALKRITAPVQVRNSGYGDVW